MRSLRNVSLRHDINEEPKEPIITYLYWRNLEFSIDGDCCSSQGTNYSTQRLVGKRNHGLKSKAMMNKNGISSKRERRPEETKLRSSSSNTIENLVTAHPAPSPLGLQRNLPKQPFAYNEQPKTKKRQKNQSYV